MNKRNMSLVIIIMMLFSGCTEKIDTEYVVIDDDKLPLANNGLADEVFEYKYKLLEDIDKDYTLDQAKDDKCVIYENGDITCGQEVWNCFLQSCDAEETATVRLGNYYTLGDPSHYSKEHYEEIKDDYPVLHLSDLTFTDGRYNLKYYDEETLINREYDFMLKYVGKANVEAIFTDYTYYVLVNDETVTWEDIWNGMISSQAGAAIDHHVVYQDKVFK